jgi:hypothetical protein
MTDRSRDYIFTSDLNYTIPMKLVMVFSATSYFSKVRYNVKITFSNNISFDERFNGYVKEPNSIVRCFNEVFIHYKTSPLHEYDEVNKLMNNKAIRKDIYNELKIAIIKVFGV